MKEVAYITDAVGEMPFTIRLAGGNKLTIDDQNGELRLKNKNNELQLTILIRSDGLVVNVNATQLNVNATEQLTLSSKKINIEAAEQLNLSSSGNFVQQVDKDALTEVGGANKSIALVQKITATLGNIELKANDDVKLDGERVRLNCD